MSAFRIAVLSIGVLFSWPALAQDDTNFVSNIYFTSGDADGRTAKAKRLAL